MQVAKGHVVTIEFELKTREGQVIETSAQAGPIKYTHGEGKILPGLEARIEGMDVGQEKTGEIPAREAFGTEESLPTKEIPRREFPATEGLEVGRVFEARGPTGAPVSFKVVEIGEEAVTVRFLHPLAGKDLVFRVKVLTIDDPQAKKKVAFVPPIPAAALGLKVDEGN